MSESHKLPPALWDALLKAPQHTLTFQQEGYEIQIQLRQLELPDQEPAPPPPLQPLEPSLEENITPLLPLDPLPPTTPTPSMSPAPTQTPTPAFRQPSARASSGQRSDKMKLQLLEESDHSIRVPHAPATPLPLNRSVTPSNTPLPRRDKASTSKAPPDALRTHNKLPMTSPVDALDMVISDPLEAAPPEPPSSPSSLSLEVVVGMSLEDTSPDPEDAPAPPSPAPSTENIASAFENAFLDDDEQSWLVYSNTSFRALRATDTPKVLELLFRRLDTHLEQLNTLLPLPNSRLAPAQIAKAAGLRKVLPHPIPITQAPDSPPNYHLVGQIRDHSYVLLYQDPSDQALHFAPIPSDGGNLQIVLVEGEALLTDEELTQLFKEGAREATPEQAEASARQLQTKLRDKDRSTTANTQLKKPLALDPISIQQHRGLEKSIPVNQRLLQRLEFNRTQDMQHLWDESIQPGISVFRYNIATLFQDQKALLEGVLLCILHNKQYVVFDRRTKRTIPLIPDGKQRIWLRHDDSLL